eukprot:SAG22_NODE_8872_length_625_cov_0.866920_1_plen_110_part_10
MFIVELAVDTLSTRALDIQKLPVFSALRPHLGRSRTMYVFQSVLSIIWIMFMVEFQYQYRMDLLHYASTLVGDDESVVSVTTHVDTYIGNLKRMESFTTFYECCKLVILV